MPISSVVFLPVMDGWCGRCQKRCGLVYLLGPGLGFGLRLCRGEVEGEGAAGQWGAGGGVRDVDREGGCGGGRKPCGVLCVASPGMEKKRVNK